MTNQPVLARSRYVPMSSDPNIRMRIQQHIDKQRYIPDNIPNDYPERGELIARKIRCYLNGTDTYEIYTEPSPLKEKVVLEDTLCVMCSFGGDPKRVASTKKALELLLDMNPLPKIVFLEGSTDGKYYFDYLSTQEGIEYARVDLTHPNFRNFFLKESLWNEAAHLVIDKDENIKYLVFLDADTFFVDRYGWRDIRDSFNRYDIISPFMLCYYTGSNIESVRYNLLSSIGYKVRRGENSPGYQGFGIGMTTAIYNYYFQGELPNPSLGLGDVLMWWMLTGTKQMKHFRMLPYREELCLPYLLPDNLNIGSSNQILGHIDHGEVNSRVYKVRSQLMKEAVRTPLSETQRVIGCGHLVSWADNDAAKDLRMCFERLLIENRRDLKISTYEETTHFYRWMHGEELFPPKAMMPNRFADLHNAIPNSNCSIPVPNRHSDI